MLSIVGTRIYMNEGDDCAFRFMYRDSDDDILNFSDSDSLTLTVKDRNTKNIIVSKYSSVAKVGSEDSLIFSFNSSDSSVLPKGDYIYDIILETSIGTKHTLIDNAPLTILENKSPKIDSLSDGEFEPHSLESIEADSIYIYDTPLVCRFNQILASEEGEDNSSGTLIIF